MKKNLLTGFLLLFYFAGHTQCSIPGGSADTSFPVTNTYYMRYDFDTDPGPPENESGINHMVKEGDTLYLEGNFTNLVSNHGRGVVFNSATKTRETTAQWRIDGTVRTSVPDGHGGFYIGGTFTSIGDSSRPFLAQIDAYGRPTAWKPTVNAAVNALYKKGDTLFIGGAFTRVASQDRTAFAIYSLSGDTLMRQLSPFSNDNEVTVNVFKAYGDSIFIAGERLSRYDRFNCNVALYNARTLEPTNWGIKSAAYDYNITCLEVSPANGLLFYGHLSQSDMVAVDLFTGENKYRISVAQNHVGGSYGRVNSLKCIGNKLFIGGIFNYLYINGTYIPRKGLCVLDIPSKSPLPVDAQLDGAVSHLEIIGNKLYVSGYFTSFAGTPREHFAELDTSSLALTDWNPEPSDPVLTISSSASKLFMGGAFNGFGSVHRNGFAAIDVRTNEVLAFNPMITQFSYAKKMMLQGDYLYILHHTDFIRITRINRYTGAVTDLGTTEYFHDFTLDNNYLYAANGKRVDRYRLSDLEWDPSWGVKKFENYYGEFHYFYLIVKDDKLYCLGIMPVFNPTSVSAKITIVDKASATIIKDWNYTLKDGTESNSVWSYFYSGVLSDDSILYVHGNFSEMNGVHRKGFLAIDMRTGGITDWNPTFAENGSTTADFNSGFRAPKLKDGKVWFGSTNLPISDGRTFWGLGAIDSSTGILLPPYFDFKAYVYSNGLLQRALNVLDIIFDKDKVYVAGYFEKANGGAFNSLARFSYQNSTQSISLPAISGRDTLFYDSDSSRFALKGAPLETASYYWTYSGDSVQIKNNGGNAVWLKVAPGATGGVLKARVQSYCGLGSEVQKTIVLVKKPYVDLSLSSVAALQQSVPQASTFTVQFTLANYGDIYSKASRVSFYLSKDSVLTPDKSGDLQLGLYDGTASVAAGDSLVNLSFPLKMSCTAGTGMFYLFSVADAANAEEEKNRMNNIAYTPVYITDGVTMPPTPDLSAIPTGVFCTGDSVQLALIGTANPSYSYTWNTGDSSHKLTVKHPGEYILTVSNSCGSVSTSRYIIERARPDATVTVSGATTFCAGDLVTLNVTATNGSTYQWNLDGMPIAGAIADHYNVTKSGNYTVTKTYYGCPALSSETVVTVHDLPAKPVITVAGNMLTTTATDSLQWYKDGVLLPGVTSPAYTATVPGRYSVSATKNGCSVTSEPYNFLSTGIVEVNTWNGEVSAYPNPMGDQLFIANKARRQLFVQLLDVNGKIMYSGKITGLLATISTRNLAAGNYILLITDTRKGETITRIVIRQ